MKKIGTSQRLLDAAERALIEGNGHFEMSEVAKCAQASVGLAYHHFGSKSGLIAAVIDRFYQPMTNIMMGDAIPKDLQWAEREKARVLAFIDYFYGHPLSPLVAGRLARTSEVLDIEHAHWDGMLEQGAKNITQGQRHGVVCSALLPHPTVAMLIGGVRMAINDALMTTPRPPKEILFEQVWMLMTNMLKITLSKNE